MATKILNLSWSVLEWMGSGEGGGIVQRRAFN